LACTAFFTTKSVTGDKALATVCDKGICKLDLALPTVAVGLASDVNVGILGINNLLPVMD
jgi:hypothetical protein